jgi:poly(hydroxyalkanoate) depolymerase family esterase
VKLNDKFLEQMQEATRLLQTAGPAAATAAIQRALQGVKSPDDGTPPPPDRSAWMPKSGEVIDINPPAAAGVDSSAATVADSAADSAAAPATDILARLRKAFNGKWKGASARQPIEDVVVDDVEVADVEVDTRREQAGRGKFLPASCTNHAGTRAYKLYVPSGYEGQALPLIVMLHGCKQNPDDFAAGTGMNAVAEQNNCFVAYPAQMHSANGSNCWNWFQTADQQRDQGEPSIIADITREVIRKYHIDPNRVYVAGLSAGGAMAAIMGAKYPELYAAVGIHSGLPVGAAHDLPSAFAAMKKGMATARKASASHKESIPVIVFHGDRDTTVHPCNGDHALAQCTADFSGKPAEQQHAPDVTTEKGNVPHGRSYTRTIQRDGKGKAIAEQWVVHGAGHAWSGGSRNGSYTDPKGPDASQEMIRFFHTHTLNGNGRNP